MGCPVPLMGPGPVPVLAGESTLPAKNPNEGR